MAIRTYEEGLLAPAHSALESAVCHLAPSQQDAARLLVLEAVASGRGGWPLDWYLAHCPLGVSASSLPHFDPQRAGRTVTAALNKSRVPFSLALTSLARPPLPPDQQRQEGSYYTDFRLARFLTAPLAPLASLPAPRLIDWASGTGILLVAAVESLTEKGSKRRAQWLERSVYGADLSERALRGAALSLASLCDSQSAIEGLWEHLRPGDSLVEHSALLLQEAPHGFDAVVGNPPWEKIKISRHEWLRAQGVERHYGAQYEVEPPDTSWGGLFADELKGDAEMRTPSLLEEKTRLTNYLSKLARQFIWQGRGESDLFKLFLEVAIKTVRPGGQLALLLPAGLIRSSGCGDLRRALWEHCEDIELSVLDNRARFFAIDTRFKFLSVQAHVTKEPAHQPIRLCHASGAEDGVVAEKRVLLPRAELASVRPDLSLPEVRDGQEWKIFRSLCEHGVALGARQDAWKPSIVREVDMTQDRKWFVPERSDDALPVVEGRMVHQFRAGAKRYGSGSGRSAVWEAVSDAVPDVASTDLEPQFYCRARALSSAVRERARARRVGFCDITGQTNERAMLAAHVPAGVVCGNKVPTILFPLARESSEIASASWLAVANSFAFDWLLRRVMTTTVNFFLLLDLPFPDLDPMGDEARVWADLVGHIENSFETGFEGRWQKAAWRAEIEWRVLRAWNQGTESLEKMLLDFPLLDRAQPPLHGEKRSTVTRDFVLLEAARNLGDVGDMTVENWSLRVERARKLGAIPFMPSHLDSAVTLEEVTSQL
ncbi:MAG TPA: N-6 DNA methylase [Abditibacterium sp.]|jgi:hypothetical protein